LIILYLIILFIEHIHFFAFSTIIDIFVRQSIYSGLNTLEGYISPILPIQ